MSTHANRRTATRRALLALVLLGVLLLPVIGFRVLAKNEPEAVSAVGAVSLNPGNRIIYIVHGRVASLALPANPLEPHGDPVRSDLPCTQVYAAHGSGVCLRKNNAVSWSATLVDRQLQATTTWPLPGRPARARVSPSGHVVAWTALTEGSRLTPSATAVTSVIDSSSGRKIDDLATFKVLRGSTGAHLKGAQVWSVSFLDDKRFLATVVDGDDRYLARGNLTRKTIRTIAPGVADAAVSPDGRRIAFIRAGAGPRRGQIAVMDLRSRAVTDLGDRRSVSDQPVWLDDDTVAWVLRDAARHPSIWAADLATRHPRLLLDNAESPSPL